MKILLVGVFTVENSTNRFLSKAFVRAGHTVEEFDYRAVSNQIGPEGMNAGLVYEVMKVKPDLVFSCKGDQLGFNTIIKINEYAKTFYWFPDPIITAAPHLVKLASVCTYLCVS